MLDLALRSALTLMAPVGFIWAGLLVLSVLLLRKREFRLAALPAVFALLIWIVGATALPGKLLGTLEKPWVGVKREALPEADAVVLLGGFSYPSREEVGGLHFNQSADRAVVALELIRLGKAKTLVVGGTGFTLNGVGYVEGDIFREILVSRQLGGPEVVSLGGCKHTRHEAEKVAKLAQERGWKRVLLVTSATHMRRAAGVFRTTTELEIVPAPSAFLTSVSIVSDDQIDLIPRSGGFGKIDGFIHEKVGWWMYRWRGWISDEAAAK
jgi:uncharacterized SAM-binding protein YcdF (DUF218 family)